ncbi:MAG: heavy metal translocating P-type ATPase [Acidimicrobiales bacterium]
MSILSVVEFAGWSRVWTVVGFVGVGIAAWSVIRTARAGRVGADVLALLAVVGAIFTGESLAAAVITVMLATGLGLEARAAHRAGRELRALIDRQPRHARRRTATGIETTPIEEVAPGDEIIVAASEVVPVDGRLLDDDAVVDESAVTGEPLPRLLVAGDAVSSGTVNGGAPFRIEATSSAADSAYAGIVRMAGEANATNAPLVRLADRSALAFLAVGLAMAGGAWAWSGHLSRAVAVLVVATPCPLILAVPIAVSSGLSRAAARGVVVKGGAVLEQLARVRVMFFDKTGTLTVGRPELVSVVATDGVRADDVIALAASLDQLSSHVIAEGIVRGARTRGLALSAATEVVEVAGGGTQGTVDGRHVRIGRAAWLGADTDDPVVRAALAQAARCDGTTVVVEVDSVVAGAIVLADRVRPEATRTLRRLRSLGARRLVMASGDQPGPAAAVGTLLDLDDVLAARTPAAKVADIRRSQEGGDVVAMVGDGINDAPALAAADIGIAMGARGGTAATESADVVLALDRLDRLAEAVAIAQRSRRIAAQSATAGMVLSVVAMCVAFAGWLPPALGAVVQEVIDVTVILNALRALRSHDDQPLLRGGDAEIARRFEREHDVMRPRLDHLLQIAHSMGRGGLDDDLAGARSALALLRNDLIPHELAEAAELYPVVELALGGSDPTAAMARSHVEIVRQTDRLAAVVADIERRRDRAEAAGAGTGPVRTEADDLGELRRILYGLHAIFLLHNIQEEEGYLSLAEPAGE